MTSRVRLLAVLSISALAGAPSALALDRPEVSPLARMVVPKAELGALATGLDLDDDSGQASNEDVANSGPRTCRQPAEIASLGRLDGYSLGYEDEDLSNVKAGSGVIGVETSVERHRDAEAASSAVARSLDDQSRNVGLDLGGIRLDTVEPFAVTDGAADEIAARRASFRIGRYRVSGLAIVFREGAHVGAIQVQWVGPTDRSAEVVTAAARLRERVEGVLSGAIAPNPVRIPSKAVVAPAGGPRLDRMALTARDLGGGAWVTRGEFVETAASGSYERELDPGCRSRQLLVESDVTIARTTDSARAGFEGIAANFRTIGAQLGKGPGRAIGLFRSATTTPISIGRVGDQRTAVRVRYRGEIGTGEYVFAMVRVNRAVLNFIVVGKPGTTIPRATVARIAGIVSKRARAVLGPDR